MAGVPDGLLTVSARIRRRTGPREPASTEVREDRASAATYEAARDEIRARLADDELVLSWSVTH